MFSALLLVALPGAVRLGGPRPIQRVRARVLPRPAQSAACAASATTSLRRPAPALRHCQSQPTSRIAPRSWEGFGHGEGAAVGFHRARRNSCRRGKKKLPTAYSKPQRNTKSHPSNALSGCGLCGQVLGVFLVLEVWSLQFSTSSPSAAGLEEALEGLGERLGGAEAQRVHAGPAQRSIQFGQALGVGVRKLF